METKKSCFDCLNSRCICKECKDVLKLCDKEIPNSSKYCTRIQGISENSCFTNSPRMGNLLKEKINYENS